MDNFGIDKTPPGRDLNEPIPFDNDTSGASVSHSPLDLRDQLSRQGRLQKNRLKN
jgi:hypothetical protein